MQPRTWDDVQHASTGSCKPIVRLQHPSRFAGCFSFLQAFLSLVVVHSYTGLEDQLIADVRAILECAHQEASSLYSPGTPTSLTAISRRLSCGAIEAGRSLRSKFYLMEGKARAR